MLTITQQVTVTDKDKCDDCTQFKSSSDCKSFGCTWTEKTATTPGSCAKTTTPPPEAFTPYCATIETASCAKTFGCALVDGKCTHFTGCSAYVKTSHSDCQSISYQCITNGVTCTDALECIAYTKEQCETTPSLRSPYKCKLEGETCRDYKCTEADSSLTTTPACSTWKAGCLTTGAGCIDQLQPCANYQGTSETCPKMRGSDGNCEFNPEGNNCRARVCTGAESSLNTDPLCAQYQDGCVTTGKGCIATKGACSSYKGNASSCIGYIGTDGDCAGDQNGEQCRARLCSEKTATTDAECNSWKSGCKTNGRQCVDQLGLCSSYQGTKITCDGLKGSDGNCKGTSTTTANCVVKDCVADSNESFNTQAKCEAIQSTCKTTGKGCVVTLPACSFHTYTDDGGNSCNQLFGSEGRCKPGTNGKCAARVCTEAPTSLTENNQCKEYLSGCVTTGAGCVGTTICQDTVKEKTCLGTPTCGWNQICVSKTSCSSLMTKSICESVKISNKPCKWDGTCRNARCDDFIATDDTTCGTLYPGCVTNGKKCVDGTNCTIQFKGNQQQCRDFTAKCTNDSTAADTAACKSRTCDDSYLTYDNDQDCENYLTNCVTKGTGCIIDTAPCNSYSGTPAQCDTFKGNKTKRCWNTSASGNCVDKQCEQATGKTGDADCEDFLTGCLYDGNGSCVPKSASCTSYTGDSNTCLTFTGNNGANPCYQGVGGKCRNKACSDDTTSETDADCNQFFPDKCITKGVGCVEKTSSCTLFSGTTEKCLTFTGNSGADKCTRLEACVSKSTTCALRTDVGGNEDCLSYHADCRFKLGDPSKCIQSVATCSEYTFATTEDVEKKQTYCNYITTTSGGLCSYDTNVTGTCSARACNLWVSTLSNITCENYNGTNSCKLNGTYCYAPQSSCASYTIPTGTAETAKLAWCNSMFTNAVTPTKCSYDSATSTTCSNIDTCEEIIAPTSAADCNKQLKGVVCQFANSKCITTKTACTGYLLTGIASGQQATYCSALKSDSADNGTGTVKQCAYDANTTANCVDATIATTYVPTIPTYTDPSAITIAACNNISSPTSQADCNLGTGSCKYYKGACYTRVACASYAIPSTITTGDEKQYFCQNMFADTADEYCSYDASGNSGNGACAAAQANCSGYTVLTAGAAGSADETANILTCSKRRIKTGSACGYTATQTTCSAPADAAASCTLVTTGITADADCDLRTILGCKKHASNAACIARDACVGVAVSGTTNDDKAANCQANPGPDSKYCSYETSGINCIVAKSACNSYSSVPSGIELTYCQARVNEKGQRCTWTSSTACTDASATCAGYTGLSGAILTQCQAKIDQTGNKCSWNTGTTACIGAPKTCAGWSIIPTSGQLEFCQARIRADGKSCSWTSGTSCTDAQAACTSLTATLGGELAYCQLRIKQDGGRCSWSSGTTCQDAPALCSGWTTQATGQLDFCNTKVKKDGGRCSWSSGTTCQDYPATCAGWNSLPGSGQLEFCLARKGLDNHTCSFVTGASACSDAPTNCSDWGSLPATQKLEHCQGKYNVNGVRCSWTSGATCRDYSCEDTVSPQSQADCDKTGTGCTYSYENQICYKKAACTSFTPTGATEDDKLKYCNNLQDTTPAACTYIKGKTDLLTCSTKVACDQYNVTNTTDKLAACKGAVPTSGKCTYFSGNTCVAVAACSTYTGGTEASIVADCAKQTDTNGLLCFGSGTACSQATCSNVISPTSIDDCKKYAGTCVYASGNCYTSQANCNGYSTSGSNAISLCNSLKNSNGDFCTASDDTDANCTNRACTDDATKSFQTHEECKNYLKSCKSNGQGCISALQTCAQQSGYLDFCGWALDTDNKSTCVKGTLATTNASCTKLTCDLNVTATSDAECINFNPDCLNKGFGCILKTEPCSAYYGTKDSCQNFTGNDKKCYGDSATVKKACRDRKCSDKATAVDDSECENFLPGCLFNGVGCVSKTDPCSAYKGTQSTCEGFRGGNGAQLCWGASTTATANCAERKCSDKVGKTDAECAEFIPAVAPSLSKCITDGNTCTDRGKQCSFFKGNDETCLLFTATDGPCKASTVSANPVVCAPRVCYEAPNTFTTDDQCSKYHPTCKTTGRGCKSSVSCGELTSQTSCTANTSCQWAGQCRTLPATCGALTTQGQTICVNTPLSTGKKCAWFTSATSSGCRDYTCSDYDGSITTHKDCYEKDPNLNCTTTGAGCITIGACSTYKSRSICEAANTTEPSVRCAWDSRTAACRQRQCADGVFTTDEACKNWLAGCKTSGTTCVGPTYGCDAFSGNPKLCQKNSSENPCLYVNGTCYDYDNCTNVTPSSFSFCQSFSTQCVPTLTTCRAITLCDKYEDINSCSIGINNTKCGWQPDNKCKEFTACSDANGTQLTECTKWGAKCVSDGTKCVDQTTCSLYLTQPACDNIGTDGLCQWTGTACRLRECTDKVDGTSDADCKAYIVKSGVCTTDGTKCVPRASCASYQTEAACTIGQDGIPCIFELPVGQTTGTKACRPKECSDIKGNTECGTAIANKVCVPNSTGCVKQETCATYKNKLSCKAGGTDGRCAFTPAPTATDPNNGSCQSFKSCENANSDQDACTSKQKACKWSSSTTGTTTTTKCQPMDCAGVASGTICNPFQSFDGTQSTICVLVNNVCTVSDPSTLSVDQCYKQATLYTYTWNESTNKCVSCKAQTNNNNNNTTNPNTSTPGTNTDDNGYILGVTIPLVILGIFA